MNALPVVSITSGPAGHKAVCSCGWELEAPDRPTIDLVSRRHRASHGKARR